MVNTLYYVKVTHTGFGWVELHIAESQTGYTSIRHIITKQKPEELREAARAAEDGDVSFILPRGIFYNNISIRCLIREWDYADEIMHETGFRSLEARSGDFVMDDGDLYFIKTRNADSNRIETHRARKKDGYNLDLHCATAFLPGERPIDDRGAEGRYVVRATDLYYIKIRNTPSGFVELYVCSAAQGYQNLTCYTTGLSTTDSFPLDSWGLDRNRNLYFIQVYNQQSGQVVLHIATAGSNWKETSRHDTGFSTGDVNDGSWLLA
ncbi:hypothetical protein CPB86DRAFT_314757 [Serendipita vermifera]|nr:hypothetical protein CPB86DRAFT_314757 [Serendipita vermifera]